jgi:hypothetical protein
MRNRMGDVGKTRILEPGGTGPGFQRQRPSPFGRSFCGWPLAAASEGRRSEAPAGCGRVSCHRHLRCGHPRIRLEIRASGEGRVRARSNPEQTAFTSRHRARRRSSTVSTHRHELSTAARSGAPPGHPASTRGNGGYPARPPGPRLPFCCRLRLNSDLSISYTGA